MFKEDIFIVFGLLYCKNTNDLF